VCVCVCVCRLKESEYKFSCWFTSGHPLTVGLSCFPPQTALCLKPSRFNQSENENDCDCQCLMLKVE